MMKFWDVFSAFNEQILITLESIIIFLKFKISKKQNFKFQKLIKKIIFKKISSKVVNQIYDPEILGKEYVMRGNSAILKCTIPSFVADFVSVTAWIDDEGTEFVISENGEFDKGKNEIKTWCEHEPA
jgi:hypothetical protein